jgi:hypothetical protein
LRKERSGFDLPLALAVLAASGQVPVARLAEHETLGELALDGRIRPAVGALAVAEAARRAGLERMLCAAESAPEVALARIEPVPLRHLSVPALDDGYVDLGPEARGSWYCVIAYDLDGKRGPTSEPIGVSTG